jgi:hypothetical protein
MNATRIIYPQYWDAIDAEVTFARHLIILKTKFCHAKSKSPNATLVVGLLDGALLDQQAYYFTTTMKNNNHGALHLPLDCNPIIKMWAQLAANVIMLSKFLKLVGITIVMVVRSERTFSTINFMKSKLCNCFTTHLNLVVWMYA